MTSEPVEIFDEPAGAYPPRFWWLKRIALASTIVITVMLVTEWWWWHAAQARLDRVVAQLHAAGEPANIDDLAGDDLSDPENAAFYLKRAASKVNLTIDCPTNSNYEWNRSRFPYPARWFKMEEASAAVDQAAFADMREARKHPRAKWVKLSTPLSNVLLSHLNQARALANSAADHAMLLHFKGNDAEAMETIADVLGQSSALDQEPFLVSHLVALGIRALATERMQMIAPELTIDGAPTTQPGARSATREQVKQMIDRMLDNSFRTQAAARNFATERVAKMDYMLHTADRQTVLRPMLQLDAAHFGASNLMQTAAKLPDWPAAKTAIDGPASVPNPARIVGRTVGYSYDAALETNFRVEEEATAAAVSIACRLYRLDHPGAPPPDLNALVPSYLPKMPIDPLAAGNKPFGYVVMNGGKRAVLYSVGRDGVDDTAAGVAIPNRPFYGWNPRVKDQYLDLLRWQSLATTQSTSGSSDEAADD